MFLQTVSAGFDLPLVASLTAFIALPVKFLIDVLRNAAPSLPSGIIPLVGVVVGFGFGAVVLVAVGTDFSAQVWAQCGIAAVGAQVAAAAASGMQNRANASVGESK